MRIVFISDFHTPGMGYMENCLPKELAAMGHDVHVVASNLTVSGNLGYEKIYRNFLGPTDQQIGKFAGGWIHATPLAMSPHRALHSN